MISVKKLVFGVGLLMMSTLAMAEGKVVVLDLQAAVLSTDVAQKRLQELEKNPDYAAMKNKYETLTEDLQNLQAEAEKNSLTWSEEKRQEKEEEAQKLRKEYEGTVQTLQGGRQRVMQSIMQQLGDQTRAALEQLIEAEKIDLVLNSQSAYHASAEYDITEKVTELLNDQAE